MPGGCAVPAVGWTLDCTLLLSIPSIPKTVPRVADGGATTALQADNRERACDCAIESEDMASGDNVNG